MRCAMDTKIKQGPKIAEITGKVVGLLEPLSSEDRQRVINASLTLLGETSIAGRPTSEPPGATNQTGGRTGKPDPTLSGLPPKAMNWMKQNGLTTVQIEDVFHIASDGAPIIASLVPGKGKKQQTYNAYVLLGVSRLLATGDATFDDKAARAACEEL